MQADNVTFMLYGFLAAWLILFAYVAMLAGRERRIRREIESLKQMLKAQKAD